MTVSMDLDRARVYRTLARMFRPPEPDILRLMQSEDLGELRPALHRLGTDDDLLVRAAGLAEALGTVELDALAQEWNDNFEVSGGLRCSPGETSHTARSSQEAWLKTYRLADIAGFYRAFGVEVHPGIEQVDHIGIELEFMHLLATKTAAARARGQHSQVEICEDAARAFLADHLGLWCDDLVRGLREGGRAPTYVPAAELLRDFVAFDRQTLGPSRQRPAHA